VLSEQVRAVQTQEAATDRRIANELEGLIEAIDQEARREHAAYMRRRESILKLCENPTLGEAGRAAVA
jgi:hypothetical protein